MDNTIENKAKFFALYWKQKTVKDGLNNSDKCSVEFSLSEGIHIEGYLELTPLSQISDEDAIQVAKIMDRDGLIDIESNDAILKMHISFARKFILFKETLMRDFETVQIVVDYLRSKGYALPYMGLSVEKLVEYNWIKLKTE